jgi:hypothetical protein
VKDKSEKQKMRGSEVKGIMGGGKYLKGDMAFVPNYRSLYKRIA